MAALAGADLGALDADCGDTVTIAPVADDAATLAGSVVLGDGGARHQRTVQALLQAGASIRLADRDGRMPLRLAQARGDTAMVAALLAAGAR